MDKTKICQFVLNAWSIQELIGIQLPIHPKNQSLAIKFNQLVIDSIW